MSSSLPEGFTVRPLRPEDAEAASAVVAAADVAVQGWSDSTPVEIRDWWRNFDLAHDAWAIESGGALVGYGEVFDHGENAEADGFVHPDQLGKGLGTWLIRRAERRARELGKSRMQSWCLAADGITRRLLQQHGFHEVRRYCRMLIELREPPAEPDWPDGVRVDTFRPEEARLVYETLNETFAEEWNFAPEPYERWRERRLTAPDFDPTLWFLVRDGEELAAVARCDRSRFGAGWVGALGVRKPWRRRGLGLALLRHVFAEFHRRGETRVALGVDAQNPTGATRLYERAGMHVAYEAVAYAKELH